MDEKPIDETRMRLLGYGITNDFEGAIRAREWRIDRETPTMGAYVIEVMPEVEDMQRQRLTSEATWSPRPAPVDLDMLREEALMDTLLQVIEYGEYLTENA